MSVPQAREPGNAGPTNPDNAGVVRQLPPERRRRRGEPVILYSCCCCTCCCLHTVGGVIGAAVAGLTCSAGDSGSDDEGILPSSQGLYWGSVTAVVIFGSFLAVMSSGDGGGILALLIFGGPLLLLAGCVLMGVLVGFNPRLRRVGRYWRAVAWIALGTVLGTIVGGLVMFPFFS